MRESFDLLCSFLCMAEEMCVTDMCTVRLQSAVTLYSLVLKSVDSVRLDF